MPVRVAHHRVNIPPDLATFMTCMVRSLDTSIGGLRWRLG